MASVRAVIASSGVVRTTTKRQPDRSTTAEDVKDPEKLARAMQDLRAAVGNTVDERTMEIEDVAVSTAGALVSFRHNFGGRVRWSVVDWEGAAGHGLARDASTDDNTLVLASYVAGTATIRIEAVG
jgi:hypothetical protein